MTGNYKTKQVYSYDNLYQLVKVDGETTYNPYQSAVPEFKSDYSQVFSFDSDGLGNMTSKVSTETVSPQKSIGDNLNYAFDYVYDNNYAHRLLRAGDRYYKYDSNGNIICEQDGSFEGNGEEVSYHKITQESEGVYSTDYGWGLFKENDSNGGAKGTRYRRTYAWNEKNQLISSIDANYNTAYVYGQDGQRSNKYTQNSETLYFNKMWTLHTDSGNNVYGGQNAKNIYLGETRIVTKLNSGENPTYQEEYYKQYYYHSDHLGSASLISDYKGDEYQRIEYTPYGETWVEKTQNQGLEWLPYKFTAKELDEETGLYYYGARYLDPKYSMWISTDPALGEYIPKAPIDEEAKKYNQNLPGMGGVFNTVNLNLYHYAANNPVKYTDPDGNFDLPYMSPKDFFSFLFKYDSGAKTLKLYADAASGDKNAQALAKAVTIEAEKEIAAEGLEVTADVAGFVSEATGDMALVAVVVQPKVAAGLETASDISSGIEVGARLLKAAITKDPKDFEKAKKTGIKNGASWFVGFSLGTPAKKISDEASTAIGGMSSKITEKIVDSVEKNHKED